MVLADSHRIPRAPCYLGTPQTVDRISPTRLSRSTAALPRASTTPSISYCLRERQSSPGGPTTPNMQHLPAITHARFSLIRFRSPLLTESLLFSLPTGTEMFHFPALPPTALYIQAEATPHDWCWVSPFGHPRINVWLATPRGLTQPPTSFIGS